MAKQIINRDGRMCTQCGSDYRLQVHHLIGVREAPDLAMDPSNLVTLCASCHAREEVIVRRARRARERQGGEGQREGQTPSPVGALFFAQGEPSGEVSGAIDLDWIA